MQVRQGRAREALGALETMCFAVGVPLPEALPVGLERVLLDGARAAREAGHAGGEGGAEAYAGLSARLAEIFPAHAADFAALPAEPDPTCNMS